MKIFSTLMAIATSLLLGACGGGGSESIVPTRSLQASAPTYNTDDLYQFFAVAFGAAPGTVYMGQLLDAANAGMSTKDIVNVFTTKDQFTSVYPLTLTNVEFATRLSANVIGLSATDQAKQNAVNDIVSALAAGWTRGDVIFAVFNNLANKSPTDQEWGGTSTKMKNQVVYAKYYTEVMKGDSTAVATLQSVISSVTETSNTLNGIEHAILAAINPLFSSTPLLLPDLRAKYETLCGENVSVQNVIPVDLNKDGKIDLVMNLWCRSATERTDSNPVINTILVLIQESPNVFVDRTKEIFGSDMVSVGGVSHDYQIWDFNGDGYPDIVFDINYEDGKSNSTGANSSIQYSSLMSAGDGRYAVIRFGTPAYMTQGVLLKDNASGGKDVVFVTSDNNSFEVYNYDGGWKKKVQLSELGECGWDNQYYCFGWTESTFYKNVAGIGSTALLLQANVAHGNQTGADLSLWTLNSDKWVKKSSVTYFKKFLPWVSIAGNTGTKKLSNIDGRDYFDYGTIYSCNLRRTPTSSLEFISLNGGYEIVGGYAGEVISEATKFLYKTKLVAYEVTNDNEIKKVPLSVLNEPESISPHRLACMDVNGDGFDDIVIYLWNADPPLIFLNTGDGKFAKVNNSVLPYPLKNEGSGQLYVDIDGDGVRDILYFPIAISWGRPWEVNSVVRFQIYKGLRNLNSLDIESIQ